MIIARRSRKNNPERGVALIFALLALLIVTALAAGMIVMSNTETNISSNFRDEQRAYFAAKAGVEELRDRIRKGTVGYLNASMPTNTPGNDNGVFYLTNPTGSESVTPWNTVISSSNPYADDEICREIHPCNASNGNPPVPHGNPWYTSSSASATYAASPVLPWKWARLTRKTNRSDTSTSSKIAYVDGSTSSNMVCWKNGHEFVTADGATACPGVSLPVYLLTALAQTPSRTRRMIQQEVAPVLFTMPGALVLDGPCAGGPPAPCFGQPPNSNNYGIHGQDASDPTDVKPAIAVLDSTAQANVINMLSTNGAKPANYTGGSSAPDVEVVPPNALSGLNTPQGIQDLSDTLKTAAGCNVYPTPPGCTNTTVNMSPTTDPPIIFVNGNWNNCQGTGILVVTGTLTCSGNPTFNGFVFAIGQGVVSAGGGGNGSFVGGMFIAKNLDASGNLLSTLGTPVYNWAGGGGNGITYDGQWMAKLAPVLGFKVIATRELMY